MTFPIPRGATHPCPKNTCPRLVKNTQYACPTHWFQISHPVRRRIVRAYTMGDFHAHAQAMDDAAAELNAPLDTR